ncbi:cytochome b5 [Lecanosticta acicola]|uniref:Cytochome b5 n=1 Tax=Lecanosticta acicola TaxID=111012 RepID=A0AAI9EE03_9PEZI|nr:cytochome b5 [Lecanosticta acicola]
MFRNIFPSWLSPAQQQEAPGESNQKSTDEGNTASSPEIHLEAGDTDGDSTPKAGPQDVSHEVPSLTLSGNETPEEDSEPAVPSFPAANSAQRASAAMLPPPRPSAANGSGLMPPPARPSPAPRPSAAASLRVPSNGPLPNRGPPAGSQQRVSSSLSPNTTVKTPNARGKVLLSPGHSPMDWAALTRKGNLSGVETFQRVTPSQLKAMTGRKGKAAWSSWQGKVYNITPYLPFHPGGEAELMKAAGRDGTKLFNEVHPWVNWENMLETCLVGILVPEDYGKSSLEDMD